MKKIVSLPLVLGTLLSVMSAASMHLTQEASHNPYLLLNNNILTRIPEETLRMNQGACNLDTSPFFNTRVIAHPSCVHTEMMRDPQHHEITIQTRDNYRLRCSLFDRSSFPHRNQETLLIVGPGFTNPKETMAPFSHLFDRMSVLLMNFRGLEQSSLSTKIQNALCYRKSTKVGAQEEIDVEAVVNYMRAYQNAGENKPAFSRIIGLGVCLGAFVFAKAQAAAEYAGNTLFDGLILDGPWLSLNAVIEVIKQDPHLINDTQRGGASPEVRWLFSHRLVSESILTVAQALLGVDRNTVALTPEDLAHIKSTPVLLIHGTGDRLIDQETFNTFWSQLATPYKLALITDGPHVQHHLRKDKHIYRTVCSLFIDNLLNINKIFTTLNEPTQTQAYLVETFRENLAHPAPVQRPVPHAPTHPRMYKRIYRQCLRNAIPLIAGIVLINQYLSDTSDTLTTLCSAGIVSYWVWLNSWRHIARFFALRAGFQE